MSEVKRRDFVKVAAGTVAGLAVGGIVGYSYYGLASFTIISTILIALLYHRLFGFPLGRLIEHH